jgi:RNA polymerase sigma factor (sigma-70 family)
MEDLIMNALSPREKEILKLSSEGIGTKQIADILNVKESSVKNNFNNILKKLRVKNRSEALLLAME